MATPENEAVLLEQARLTTGHQLEQICRKYASVRNHDFTGKKPIDDQLRRYVTFHDTEDGMVAMKALFHPEEAAIVRAAIERIAIERCRERDASTSNSPAVETTTTPPTTAQHVPAGTPAVSESIMASAAMTTPPTTTDATRDVPAGTPAHASSLIGFDVSGPSMPPFCALELLGPGKSKNRPGFDRADALVLMAQQVLRGNTPNRTPTELLISIPLETLQDTHDQDPMHVACCADGTALSAAPRAASRAMPAS